MAREDTAYDSPAPRSAGRSSKQSQAKPFSHFAAWLASIKAGQLPAAPFNAPDLTARTPPRRAVASAAPFAPVYSDLRDPRVSPASLIAAAGRSAPSGPDAVARPLPCTPPRFDGAAGGAALGTTGPAALHGAGQPPDITRAGGGATTPTSTAPAAFPAANPALAPPHLDGAAAGTASAARQTMQPLNAASAAGPSALTLPNPSGSMAVREWLSTTPMEVEATGAAQPTLDEAKAALIAATLAKDQTEYFLWKVRHLVPASPVSFVHLSKLVSRCTWH